MSRRDELTTSVTGDASNANQGTKRLGSMTQWVLDSSENNLNVGICGRSMPLRILLEEIHECQSLELVEAAYEEMINLLGVMPDPHRPDVKWMSVLVEKLEPYVDHCNDHGPVHLALAAILTANEEAQIARRQPEK